MALVLNEEQRLLQDTAKEFLEQQRAGSGTAQVAR